MGRVMFGGGKIDMKVPVPYIVAGNIPVGSIIKLLEEETEVEYLVINQGIPNNSSLYDDSCDGTWLLRRNIIEEIAWSDTSCNTLETSKVQLYLNSTMINKYDDNTKSFIKQVKIPYRKDGGTGTDQSGLNGLSCKLFSLSACEVGINNTVTPQDGEKLDYFLNGEEDSEALKRRISYFNESAYAWNLRSPRIYKTGDILIVQDNGILGISDSIYAYGVRPALILQSDALFDKRTMLLKGVA